MGENITVQQYQAMLARAGNAAEADSMKARMAQQGWTIGGKPIRGPIQTPLQNIQEQTGKYDLLGGSSRAIGDVLPGAAAMILGGGPTGVVRKGILGGLLKAGVRMGMAGAGGAGGELIRENVYRGTGEQAPPSPAAGMMGDLGVPTQPLQEAAAQAAMQGVGDLMAAPVRAAGKLLLKLPGRNLKWDTAEEALKQNVPLNIHNGIKMLKERAQPVIAKLSQAIAGHTMAGTRIHAQNELLNPAMINVRAAADISNTPDVVNHEIDKVLHEWQSQSANMGTVIHGVPMINPNTQLTPGRLLEIVTDAKKQPGVLKAYTKREIGAMPVGMRAPAQARASFYTALADQGRDIIKTKMPDIHELNQELSRSFNLQEGIQRGEGGRNIMGQLAMRHTGAIVGAIGGGVGIGDEGEGIQGRAKHALGWAALTEAMSTPRGINFLTEVARQSPRVINTLATWASNDTTKRVLDATKKP
jgi:hypothetical protein